MSRSAGAPVQLTEREEPPSRLPLAREVPVMHHAEELRFLRRARELESREDVPLPPREPSAVGAPAPRPARRRGLRRATRAVGALALLAGGAAVVPRFVLGERIDPAVAAIDREPVWRDGTLLAEAFALPVAAAYARGGLDAQRNPTFCGPTTAVDVARSLGLAADQGHALDGTGVRAPLGILWRGVTLDEEAEILRARTGRRVTVLRGLGLEAFREELRHANDPGRRYAVNFSRGPLFGRGGGHHSPIGGYLAERDLVLVLDVNGRFGPWLVPTERLWRAVETVDAATGRKRGILRVE